MLIQSLFEQALSITSPWYIKDIEFDVTKQQLDIHIDFHKGATFTYIDDKTGEGGDYKAYDTEQKTWRHLNFFEHKCYLHCRTVKINNENTRNK